MESLLLVFSLPVLLPSLIFLWIGAKRWGRIPLWMLVVDGGVFALLTMRSPPLFLVMAFSWVCLVALWGQRRDKLDYGIFLGYSNAVAWRLIFGGILAGIGIFLALPWRQIGLAADVLAPETSIRTSAVTDLRVPVHRRVALEGAALDWEGRAYGGPEPGGMRWFARDPRESVAVANASELWGRRSELAGRMVALSSCTATQAYLRPGFEYELDAQVMARKIAPDAPPPASRLRDSQTRAHAVVDGSDGRVWLVSPPVSSLEEPAAAAWISSPACAGLLAAVYADPQLSQQYAARNPGKNAWYVGVGLLPFPPLELKGADTFVPVAGSGRAVWLRYAGKLERPPEAVPRGIYEGNFDWGLSDHLAARVRAAVPQELHLIDAAGALEYLRRRRVPQEIAAGLAANAAAWLGPGLALLVWGLALARRE